MAGITTRLGPSGGIVIPAEYRKALGVEVGDEIVLRLEEGEIRMTGRTQAIRRAQRTIRRYVGAGRLLPEELIASRRAEGVEADELLMPMALHAAADDGTFQDIQCGEQRGRAVALVVVGHRAGSAFLHRQAGLGAVERLNLALFVHRQHDRMCRRVDVEADHVLQLVGKLRIVGELELADPVRRETRSWLRQMRCTEETLIPVALAIAAAVQWVASPGGSPAVNSTTRAITVLSKGGLRDGRVLARSRPYTPACMNRSCRRQTTDLLLPVCRMIAAVPSPSAVKSTIRARQTCFCGLFRLATIAASRARSSALTCNDDPLAHPRNSHTREAAGIPKGTRALGWDH